ncbi:MAG: class I SAM-dependent methyltransferase [Actinomycetota bacterium]
MADAMTDARVRREQAFHDERFANDDDDGRDRFYDHVDGAVEALRAATVGFGPGHRVLELGCGVNSLGWELAARGVEVHAIDISPVAVDAANAAAETQGLTAFRATVMNAESLDADPASFDGVVGTGILHHLDIDAALAEIARVLRPEGRAVFYEPLGHNPAINAYRRRTPTMRSVDEHPLLRRDLTQARTMFGGVDASMHECLALGAAFVPGVGSRVRPVLQALDRLVLQLPGVRWLGWITVVTLTRPKNPPKPGGPEVN